MLPRLRLKKRRIGHVADSNEAFALHKDSITKFVEFRQSGELNYGDFWFVPVLEAVARCARQDLIRAIFLPIFRQARRDAYTLGDNMIQGHCQPNFIRGGEISSAISAQTLTRFAHEIETIPASAVCSARSAGQSVPATMICIKRKHSRVALQPSSEAGRTRQWSLGEHCNYIVSFSSGSSRRSCNSV